MKFRDMLADVKLERRSRWNVFKLEMPEAPAQEEIRQAPDKGCESPDAFLDEAAGSAGRD